MRLNHSYSAFKQFDNCPLRYYRQRVLKDIKDEMGEAGLEGDRQHKALEIGRASCRERVCLVV